MSNNLIIQDENFVVEITQEGVEITQKKTNEVAKFEYSNEEMLRLGEMLTHLAKEGLKK